MFLALKRTVLFKLLAHADGLSQAIFWGLIALSVLCWWTWIYKSYSVWLKIKHLNEAIASLESTTTLEEVVRLGAALHKTISGRLISSALLAFRKSAKMGNFGQEYELIKLAIEQSLSSIKEEEERYLGILQLSSETGPLIGLFGTVWGLIHAFNRISEKQTADIPTVAPGIAEALVVTLIGLFVAIPALVMYYLVRQKLNYFEEKLWAVADRLCALFSLRILQTVNVENATSTAAQAQ